MYLEGDGRGLFQGTISRETRKLSVTVSGKATFEWYSQIKI